MTQIFLSTKTFTDSAGSVGILHDFARNGYSLAGGAPIGPEYSSASGFRQLGSIHGLSLRSAPGSAAEILKSLTIELEGIHKNLNTTGGAFAAQDIAASLAINIADIGGMAQRTVDNFVARDVSGASPLHKEPVIVAPDVSVTTLLGKLAASNGGAAVASQGIWNELALRTAEIATGMSDLANYISSSNSGAAPDAISARLRSVASRAGIISANSAIFETNLGGLEVFRNERTTNVAAAKASLDAMRATGPEGLAAAEAAEKIFLLQYAATTQASLTGLIPPVVNLTSADTSNVGGTADTGMNDVPGTGIRYSTSGVVVPQALADQVLDYAARNPENFEAINSATRDMAAHAGADLEQGLFSPQGIQTQAATAGGGFSPPSFSPLGGPTGGISPAPANPGLAAINGAGAGLAPPVGSIVGGVAGRTPGATHGSIYSGSSPQRGLLNSNGGSRSVPNPLRGGSGLGIPFGAGGLASPDAENARRTIGVSSSPTAPGAVAQNPQGRGAPTSSAMTGMGGRGAPKENRGVRVRTVTSGVEREGNLRDLLGPRKPVVPGVIGDWVRQ